MAVGVGDALDVVGKTTSSGTQYLLHCAAADVHCMHYTVDDNSLIGRVRRFAENFRCPMFRYLGEKIPMSNTDSDVYRCEVRYIFLHSVSVVLFCFSLM